MKVIVAIKNLDSRNHGFFLPQKILKGKGYMVKFYSIPFEKWNTILKNLISEYNFYAPIKSEEFLDYEKINPDNVENISYNVCKPTSLLTKNFP